jgi:hypothetical protein
MLQYYVIQSSFLTYFNNAYIDYQVVMFFIKIDLFKIRSYNSIHYTRISLNKY